MTLTDVLARARAIRDARGLATTDPVPSFDHGAVLGYALYLRHEAQQARESVRKTQAELDDLLAAVPWLTGALACTEGR